MLVYYKVLQGVHGQEIAQNVFRDIIIDPPDPQNWLILIWGLITMHRQLKELNIDMGMIIQISKQTFHRFAYLQ